MEKSLMILLLYFVAVSASATELIHSSEGLSDKPGFVSFKIDKVVIDMDGLMQSTGDLSNSIGQLSSAIESLSKDNPQLSAEDRESLLSATDSVNQASQAITRLADELPVTAHRITQQLPELIANTRQPVADVMTAVQSASTGMVAITNSYPEVLRQVKKLTDDVSNSILQKVSIFLGVFLLILFLGFGGLVFYFHRKVISPIMVVADELKMVPAQLHETSVLVQKTSKNLLELDRRSRRRTALR